MEKVYYLINITLHLYGLVTVTTDSSSCININFEVFMFLRSILIDFSCISYAVNI